ncbi:MAG: hypothetical protein OEV31_05165, partial [Gammaproteobacteria bacterium]|nr:hypothetical protein [Gammaproteobacteria bacterium]
MPQTGTMLERPRLLRRLDQLRRGHRMVWVTAPPGSGKTALLAQYVASRRLAAFWYQLDAGDSDVSSFFYHLGVAARRSGRRRDDLPALTPEYLPGLAVFARRFFERLFARVRRPFVLVLDNYQELSETSPVHDVLAVAAAELPRDISILVASRVEPPRRFFGAGDAPGCFDNELLPFTRNEADAIARQYGHRALSRGDIDWLHAETGGWVAGLMLGFEQAEPGSRSLPVGHASQKMYDYFADEVFEKTPWAAQEILLKTAFLPDVTLEQAEQVAGSPEAGRLLADLHRKNYFTFRLGGERQARYRFHPLFHTFLRNQARYRLSAEAYAETLQHAARLLMEAGRGEEAVDLLRLSASWEEIIDLVRVHAPRLMAEGRGRVVEGWLQSLPEPVLAESSWSLYWLAVARHPFDPLQAQALFERAYQAFDLNGESEGLYLSWCGMIESICSVWIDLKPLTRWITAFETIQNVTPCCPTPATEARVTCAMFTALLYGAPRHPELAHWAGRAAEVMRRLPDPAAAIGIGYQLVNYHIGASGTAADARPVADLMQRLSGLPHATPLARLILYYVECYRRLVSGDYAAVLESVDAARQIETETGVTVLRERFRTMAIWAHVALGNTTGAQAAFDELASSHNPAADISLAVYHTTNAGLALERGEYAVARDRALNALAALERIGLTAGEVHARALAAQACAALGEEEAARSQAEKTETIVRETGVHTFATEAFAALALALLARRRGDDERAREAVRRCMEILRSRDVYYSHARRADFSWACALALENGIETGFVRELICRNRLAPSGVAVPEDWPFPVRIRTLGGFAIEVEGKPLCFDGRVQRKPLDLLKVLIALGGNAVPALRVIDELWPGSKNGKAGEDALATALRRLRALLGPGETVVLRDNRLSLNPERVWVDAQAFEAYAARPAIEVERLLNLYRGPFLDGEPDDPLYWTRRERMRARLLRAILQAGRQWCDEGRHAEAISLFERGIDIDPLAEEFYASLMRVHAELGRYNEALSVYRRCEKTLGAV